MNLNARWSSRLASLACVSLILLIPRIGQPDGPREHKILSAIRESDFGLLESHLREGAPVNIQTSDGTTPLMLASLFGSADMVRLLLEHGADPNVSAKSGATALLFAVGDLKKVQLLLDRGASVNVRSSLGNTPLIAAAAYPDNLKVIQLLLEKGADPQAKNLNNISALTAAVFVGNSAAARILLDRGCKPEKIRNFFGAFGLPTLALAAVNGDREIVDLLLSHGADPNDADGTFAGHPLNWGLMGQNPEVALRLIDAGADINRATPNGKIPPLLLSTYFENGDLSVAKAILAHGADPAAAGAKGETALTWAHRRGFPELSAIFSKAGTPDPADPRPDIPNRQIEGDAAKREAYLRAAIQKSIALLQHSSDVFLENRRSCVSCHHQNLPGVAMGWARDRGFSLDEDSADRMLVRQMDSWAGRLEAAHEMDQPYPAPPQFLGYGLWGASALGLSADATTDGVVRYLAATQRPDGRWNTANITRPPLGGQSIQSTALAMRSLQLYPLPSRRDEMRARVERAKQWLADSKPDTHEERIYKLLGLAWAGVPPAGMSDDLQTLRAAQRPDGGWAQLPNLESDAWATGESLVALRIAGGMPPTDPVFSKGTDYLLRTQFDDGSWYVKSRAWPFQPPFDSEFPFGRDQWISAGATAWATMALLLNVEPVKPSIVPSRSDRVVLASVAPGSPTPKVPSTDLPASASTVPRRTDPIDFARDIKPVLERSCVGCHSGEIPKGGFRVVDRDSILHGGESGEAAIRPGQSGSSPLFLRISGADSEKAMPPLKKRDKFPALSPDQLRDFRAWIDEGAPWPDGVAVKAASY